MVGQADIPDLALPDEIVVCRQGLIHRSVRIGIMSVVEVNVVSFQPAQTRLDLTDDVTARQAAVVNVVPDDSVGLGSDYHLVATTAKGAAENLLGGFTIRGRRGTGPVEDRHVAIHVGGVHKVDAHVDSCAYELVGGPRRGSDPERGGTQTNPGHFHAGRTEN